MAGGVLLCAVAEPQQHRDLGPILGLKGRLIFHRYTSYDAWDSRLYLYDFTLRALKRLGNSWGIDHAMNAHFSPDGADIVFMGVEAGHHTSSAWDIYIWNVDSSGPPVDLTAGNGLRDEDPKFAPDGKTIVFKQDGRVKRMDLTGRIMSGLPDPGGEEQSMPFPMSDGSHIVYAAGDGPDMRIVYCLNDGAQRRELSGVSDMQSYYPIGWGADRVLFVRWVSAQNQNDQIYCANLRTGQLNRMPFDRSDQNFSDPYPANDRFIFFSSTGMSSKGGYDLYLGDAVTGRAWSLSDLGVNSQLDELGSCYTDKIA